MKSKMKNLEYSELRMQEYLELRTMNKRQAFILFKFRVRMTPFGENFWAGVEKTVCPLCSLHVDSQEESFHCAKLRLIMEVKGKYSQVFGSKFPQELVQTLVNIYHFRDEYRKMTSKKWTRKLTRKGENLLTKSLIEAHVHLSLGAAINCLSMFSLCLVSCIIVR